MPLARGEPDLALFHVPEARGATSAARGAPLPLDVGVLVPVSLSLGRGLSVGLPLLDPRRPILCSAFFKEDIVFVVLRLARRCVPRAQRGIGECSIDEANIDASCGNGC